MRYTIDRMTMADIPRVIEIEKLAYPTPWPPSAYRKELQENRHAHYILVRDTRISGASVPQPPDHPEPQSRRPFPLSLLPARPLPAPGPDAASIVGFAGLWLMIDEAHVTTIAVHPDYRGRGLGELMLCSLVGISYEIGARHVTLEVRVSNAIAQNLYRKYGFSIAGSRRRYYSDNHEDAYIMTTHDIYTDDYRQRYAELRANLYTRLSTTENASPSAGQPSARSDM
ncbi:MAG TPA: ribosomal protein S18-alanine N-acetyltransferase [Ktedonobacterales bacterium]|nr:ribosomal protein S18-alanine N-acetyltransferase [Ktedonobacterales bacterium]